MEKDIYILAIESSCDETAAAVVKNGRCVLSNVISSQIELHKLYGGVVPEIASRKHIEKINQVIEEALEQAGVTLEEIDAIGVTYGPGLGWKLFCWIQSNNQSKKLPECPKGPSGTTSFSVIFFDIVYGNALAILEERAII